MNNKPATHPSAFEFSTLILVILTSILGAIIGMQIVSTLGVTPNTSIIGALIAMLIARIPIAILQRYRSVHRQNLVQTAISSATFGAANSLFIPIGIPFVMGEHQLIIPMLIGAVLAMFIDAVMLYRFFDSRLFPAKETWAPGVATAEAIIAGDKGGKRAGLLGIGTGLGLIGSFFNLSMSAFGVAFIGNIWALSMFGIGLLIRQYSVPWFGLDVNALYIAHGIMIGAGIVALIQAIVLIFRKKEKAAKNDVETEVELTRPSAGAKKTLGLGYLAYLAVALIIAITGGLITEMSPGLFIAFLFFAAFAAIAHEIIVGIAAMHSGWFPAFAVAFITLLVGMMIGFPPTALALLAGFSAATGPAFADSGYDLKAGYILRGNGKNRKYEIDGRKQQFITGLIALGIAVIVMVLAYNSYFAQKLIPPIDTVYVSTIQAGTSMEVARQLLIWAIPGALIQLIGGPKRQLGVLFATGLLILSPNACWLVLLGLAIRITVIKLRGKEAETPMSILAAGFIAGDAIYGFFNSIFKMSK